MPCLTSSSCLKKSHLPQLFQVCGQQCLCRWILPRSVQAPAFVTLRKHKLFRDIAKFIGFVKFYSMYIHHFKLWITPLHKLTTKCDYTALLHLSGQMLPNKPLMNLTRVFSLILAWCISTTHGLLLFGQISHLRALATLSASPLQMLHCAFGKQGLCLYVEGFFGNVTSGNFWQQVLLLQ